MKTFVEASFKVDVAGLPPIFMDARSSVEIRKKLRKQLKFPDDIENIERITKGEKIKSFKDRLKTTLAGKGQDVEEMNKPSSDHMAKLDKIPVSQMTPAQKKANTERRKEYKAYQIKKGITPFVPHPDKVKEAVNEEDATEALDMKQRLARGRSARKNKSKLAMGRKKAGRRIASMTVLKKRARRAARKTMTKRLTKGIAKADLSVSRKREIEKRLDKPAFKIKANRLVKRTIKDIRKKEIARKRK